MLPEFKIYYHTHAIISRSWLQAALEYKPYKDKKFLKNLLKNKEMVFENGVKNIQAADYNGARTVHSSENQTTDTKNLLS